MTKAQPLVVKDEDLLPEERQWLFGSDENKEKSEIFLKILYITNRVMALIRDAL